MQTDREDTVPLAADGLSWAIATSRWLRQERARGAVVELDGDGIATLLSGLAGIQEILADYLRCPGVLPPRSAVADVVPCRPALRVIPGGKTGIPKSRKAEIIDG